MVLFLDVDDHGALFRPVVRRLVLVVRMASWLLLESRADDCSMENHRRLRRLEWPMMFQGRRDVGVKDRTLRMGSEMLASGRVWAQRF